jgi:DNA-binding HxlR family transcriptional regulator
MLIVRDAFRGVTGFEDFHRGLGIARTVLSARFDRLVAPDTVRAEPS